MVNLTTVEEQLKAIGCNFKFWGRSELRELSEVLLPGETIAQVVNGTYEAGFGLLCATDFRVLLIDKKPRYLTLKDIRFDMITELDFANSILSSTVRIYTPNRDLRFTTPSARRLRKLFTYVQHKVMENRHHFMMQQFQQTTGSSMLSTGMDSSFGALPSGQNDQFAAPTQAHHSDEQKRLATAMGALGLHGIGATAHVINGKVVRAYTSTPFSGRWRKRPYGYSN